MIAECTSAGHTIAGIDVCKARLDVAIAGGPALDVANHRSGIAGLIRTLRRAGVTTVGLEASGGYERLAADRLQAAGLTVYLLDPAQVRAFARAMKTRAKTDQIDARMIARYVAAAADRLVAYQPDPDRARLGELAALRRRLVAQINQYTSQLDLADEPLVRQVLSEIRAALKARIARLETAIAAHVTRCPTLQAQFARLKAVPGVGPVLATTLISELPELGHIDARSIAALVGVAPHARQSGRTDRGGRCSGGRMQVRNVLYMATLSVLKARMPHLSGFYQRLRGSGKPHKCAIVATMRKFLTILNAIIRDDTVFRPT